MRSVETNRWMNEFNSFLNDEALAPPLTIERTLRESVHRDLHPSLGHILFKIASVHIFTGTLTLFFCPQFGVSFAPGAGLFNFFMRFGHGVCMAACGVTFIGGTALIASWLLSTEEIRRLRAQPLWPWAVLSAVSLGLLHASGAGILQVYALIWLAAAAIAGSGLLEAGWRLRLYFRHRWAH